MKNKNKVLIIIGVVFILVIGINLILNKDHDYYKNVSDIVVGFFNSSDYDETLIKAQDQEAIENHLSKLTHENEVVDLSEFIIKEKTYYTTLHNTSGVYKKDGKCYIEYEKLDFDKPVEEVNYEMEPYKKVICDNYFVVLYKSMFYPEYEVTKSNPKYDYVFEQENVTEDGYEFLYYSTYDGTGLKVKLLVSDKTITEVELEFLNKGE